MSAQMDEEKMAPLQDDPDAVVERFHATSGRLTGWLTVAIAGGVVLAGLAYLDKGFPAWVVGLALLVGVLAWAAMLRPALWATEEHLVMRNLADTVHIRLAAVEEMAVRQVLAVRAADRRFVSTVVGRSWRKAIVSRRTHGADDGPRDGMAYADWAEHRLHELVDGARKGAGVRPGSREQLALPDPVRREHDVLPLSLIAVSGALLLLSLFL